MLSVVGHQKSQMIQHHFYSIPTMGPILTPTPVVQSGKPKDKYTEQDRDLKFHS